MFAVIEVEGARVARWCICDISSSGPFAVCELVITAVSRGCYSVLQGGHSVNLPHVCELLFGLEVFVMRMLLLGVLINQCVLTAVSRGCSRM